MANCAGAAQFNNIFSLRFLNSYNRNSDHQFKKKFIPTLNKEYLRNLGFQKFFFFFK